MRYEFRRRCRIIWFCIGSSPLRSTLVDQLVLVTTLFSCNIDNVCGLDYFGLLPCLESIATTSLPIDRCYIWVREVPQGGQRLSGNMGRQSIERVTVCEVCRNLCDPFFYSKLAKKKLERPLITCIMNQTWCNASLKCPLSKFTKLLHSQTSTVK